MTFEEWMLDQRGLRPSSVRNYVGAIKGRLLQWAVEKNIMDESESLISLTSITAFRDVKSKIERLTIFRERNRRGHKMYSNALDRFAEYLEYFAEAYAGYVEADIDAILNDSAASPTERHDLIKCRIGQGKFRQALIDYWQACAVTGYKDIGLLVASHIKPWRECTNAERLNQFNGLLLIPNLDRAFDAGLITFRQDGLIWLSPHLSNPQQLGIETSMRVTFASEHEPFMDFHRESVFRSE
jgi:hypothetical protein